MDSGQVLQRVVIASHDVVYAVCAWSVTDVADAPVPLEDLVADLRPVGRESVTPRRTGPASAGHYLFLRSPVAKPFTSMCH